MPAPIPDLTRDQQCHHYQAPSGQRCGSPAMKSEYYCYHHLAKNNYKKNHRVLIDPEITCMEIPPIEDRASIFVALAAVIHRLAENTIDTRRAGQMIYGLQVAMRALDPPPGQRTRTSPAATQSDTCSGQSPASPSEQGPAAPKTIKITKESLLYFLRSRHCYHCNTELFPAHELTERSHPGAPAEIIEESKPRLGAPEPLTAILPALNAVASDPDNPEAGNRPPIAKQAAPFLPFLPSWCANRPHIPHSSPHLLYTLLGARYP